MRIWIIAGLLAVAIATRGADSAFAAVDPPKTAGALVALCKSNDTACDEAIVDSQLLTLALDVQNNTRSCYVPQGISHDQGTRAIVDWLQSHPESQSLPTDKGIAAAIKGVWQCATKVDTGFTSSGVPDKIGRFIAFCSDKANYVKCANESIEGGLTATAEITFNGSSKHCELPKGVKTQDIYAKIMPWLIAHPETHNLETNDGLVAATDAIWPCKTSP